MKTGKLVLAFLCLALGAGCSNGSGSNSSNNSESYSYEITYNNCPTGKHTFSSKDDLCAGLKDDHLNAYCARETRKQEFAARSCSGSFDSSPVSTNVPMQTVQPTPNPDASPEHGSASGSASGPSQDSSNVHWPHHVPPNSVQEATAGWKQKLVVKTRKFDSEITTPCADLLCLVARTGGEGSMKIDPQDAGSAIQKFWAQVAPGVVLECERSGPAIASTAKNVAKGICRLSVDPSQSSATVQIRVSKKYSSPVVSIAFQNPPLVNKWIESISNAIISNGETVTLTANDGAQEKQFPRMSLFCTEVEGGPSTCTLLGVVNAQ